jgi:hypothetical protein
VKTVAEEPNPAWTAKWIQAPWSTERDGAELDGAGLDGAGLVGSRPMPVFRREFVVRAKPVKATLRIAGLGQFEARIGSKEEMHLVSPHGLHEAWTDYRKTVTFEGYDVTRWLTPGAHVLGVMLGNGMYNVQKTKGRYTKFDGSFGVPKLIAELRVRYADGKTETIATDGSWKVERGPVLFSSIYGGEDFDARKQQDGWDRPGFAAADWVGANETDGPGGELMPAITQEVREGDFHEPVAVKDLGQGRVLYDLGVNFAGVPFVRVEGPAGATLKLVPGELLKPDGSVTQASSGGPMWWSYTIGADGKQESWSPQFGYYGFRYVQAEWVGGNPGKIDSISGMEWHSAAPVAGSFESSSEMLNAIHKLIVNAMHNNEVSIFTDCPHREKLGWLEETHLVANGLMFNNDLRGLYAATAKNIADAQHEDGDVPTIAPQYTRFGPKYAIYDDSPEWGSASVLGQWAAYRFYGDKAALEKNYATMQRYVKFLEGKAQDGIVSYGLGDWYDIGPGAPGVSKLTSLGVTGTLMLYEDARAIEKIATILGRDADAAMYAELAKREAAAFNQRYWDGAKGYYDKGSQTANAMPLALGIVPEEHRAALLQHIVDDIHAHDDHITTGEVGYPYLLRVLMESGHNDVVLSMMLKKTPPSYGSQLAAGATSLTEAWDASPHSQDHFMLGGAEEWFYRALGGIDFDMTRDADERITIRPQMLDGVDWVKCSYRSVLGPIRTEWQQEAGKMSIDVAVPPGATATVILPVKMAPSSPENALPAGHGPQLTEVRRDAQVIVYRATAGLFHFREAE